MFFLWIYRYVGKHSKAYKTFVNIWNTTTKKAVPIYFLFVNFPPTGNRVLLRIPIQVSEWIKYTTDNYYLCIIKKVGTYTSPD